METRETLLRCLENTQKVITDFNKVLVKFEKLLELNDMLVKYDIKLEYKSPEELWYNDDFIVSYSNVREAYAIYSYRTASLIHVKELEKAVEHIRHTVYKLI